MLVEHFIRSYDLALSDDGDNLWQINIQDFREFATLNDIDPVTRLATFDETVANSALSLLYEADQASKVLQLDILEYPLS